METFVYNAGVTYYIEAKDEEEANDKGYELMVEDWGEAFAQAAWTMVEWREQ